MLSYLLKSTLSNKHTLVLFKSVKKCKRHKGNFMLKSKQDNVVIGWRQYNLVLDKISKK
jgi:hypothetical protein